MRSEFAQKKPRGLSTAIGQGRDPGVNGRNLAQWRSYVNATILHSYRLAMCPLIQ